METKDDVLVAIEAGEGLRPIHVENVDISQNPMQQSQTQTSGIRFEIFERHQEPHGDNWPHVVKVNNTIVFEDENNATTPTKMNQGESCDKET